MSDKRKKLSSINWEHYSPAFRKKFEELVKSNPWNEYERLRRANKKADEALLKAMKQSEESSKLWLAKTETIHDEMKQWREGLRDSKSCIPASSFQETMLVMAIEDYEP